LCSYGKPTAISDIGGTTYTLHGICMCVYMCVCGHTEHVCIAVYDSSSNSSSSSSNRIRDKVTHVYLHTEPYVII
jgi:hypothetical protein